MMIMMMMKQKPMVTKDQMDMGVETWLLGMMGLPGKAKLGYGPEDKEEGHTRSPLPKITLGNLRNWSQGLSWGHVPGFG